MLTTIQFPLCDVRKFISGTGQLTRPAWPIPTPDLEFVRYCGIIRQRVRGGLSGWVGENDICEARRAVRLKAMAALPKRESYRRQVVAYRRLYADGLALAKFELAIAVTGWDPVELSKKETEEYIQSFLGMPVQIRDGRGGFSGSQLVHGGQHLSTLYWHATTASTFSPNGDAKTWWIRPGKPVLVLRRPAFDDMTVPFRCRKVAVRRRGFELCHGYVSHSGQRIHLWIIDEDDEMCDEFESGSRKLRIYISRLHAEHECLRLVLQLLLKGQLVVAPRSRESDSLQQYFNEATRHIGMLEASSSKQYDDEICRIARASFDLVDPAQLDTLQAVLDRVDMRKNIRRKVGEYVEQLGAGTVVVAEEVTLGDKYQVGQAGAVGPNAHAHDMNFAQVWNQSSEDIDLGTLADQLKRLREELGKSTGSAEESAALGNIANAEIEARKGNGPKVLEFLSRAGKWALDAALTIGIPVAVAAIKKAIGA